MEMVAMVLDKNVVEQQLAEIISRGDFRCFRCGKPLGGNAIEGLQLEASDGKPKILYKCDNPICPNSKKGGYRTLLALGIADNLTKVEAASPLAAAKPPADAVVPTLIAMGPNGPEAISPVSAPESSPLDDDDDDDEDSDGVEDQHL